MSLLQLDTRGHKSDTLGRDGALVLGFCFSAGTRNGSKSSPEARGEAGDGRRGETRVRALALSACEDKYPKDLFISLSTIF